MNLRTTFSSHQKYEPMSSAMPFQPLIRSQNTSYASSCRRRHFQLAFTFLVFVTFFQTIVDAFPTTTTRIISSHQNYKVVRPTTNFEVTTGKYRLWQRLRNTSLCVSTTYGGDDRQRRRKQGQQQRHGADKTNAAVVSSSHPLLLDLNQGQQRLFKILGNDQKSFHKSKRNDIISQIEEMFQLYRNLKKSNQFQNTKEKEMVLRTSSIIIDESIRAVTNRAFFLHKHYMDADVVFCGLDVLEYQLQKGTGALVSPYNTIPKSTWINALRALHNLQVSNFSSFRQMDNSWEKRRADASFSVIKRLIAGKGIRHWTNTNHDAYLEERDFSCVLKAFVDIHHMEMAHRVMALQERTKTAPPLSSVPYSIMIKAYGRDGDATNVERVWKRAIRSLEHNVDVILCNSAMDAFINCQQLSKAQHIFTSMMASTTNTERARRQFPVPNIRTFNTLLKGYAKEGLYEDARKLFQQIEEKGIKYDHITINTLVSAAVKSNSFRQAEEILANTTTTITTTSNQTQSNTHQRHPNVEAYTELLDGYAKVGMINQALHTLKVMRQRGVQPNDYTYSSILQALAKFGKIPQAKKMLQYMEYSDHIKPTVVTYNALLTGLLTHGIDNEQEIIRRNNLGSTTLTMDQREEEAFELLNKMTSSGIIPNAVTVATLVNFLTLCCEPARMDEAEALISQLEKTGKNRSPYSVDKRISTVLIQAYAKSKDLLSATRTFSQIQHPDVVALNAYIDTCCKCGKMKTALKTFQIYCASKQQQHRKIAPDVITYTVIISALLDYKDNLKAGQKARELYWELKNIEGKLPDTGLVDT